MNTFQMTFTPLHPIDGESSVPSEDTSYKLWDYLTCLYKNGQILRIFHLVKTPSAYLAFATLPEDNALDSHHNNAYVTQSLAQVKTLFTVSLQPLGANLNVIDSCACPEKPPWYMLYSDWTEEESPVVCGACGHSIPLYKLPRILNEGDYYSTLKWKQDYQNIHRLFMGGLSDRSTYRQLNSMESPLSQKGLEICRAFAGATGIPFYYYVYHDRKHKKTPALCPLCGREWKLSGTTASAKTFIDYKCDRCGLVADEA
jgi:predicted  nucleic acid-binding Zn ribbon protein